MCLAIIYELHYLHYLQRPYLVVLTFGNQCNMVAVALLLQLSNSVAAKEVAIISLNISNLLPEFHYYPHPEVGSTDASSGRVSNGTSTSVIPETENTSVSFQWWGSTAQVDHIIDCDHLIVDDRGGNKVQDWYQRYPEVTWSTDDLHYRRNPIVFTPLKAVFLAKLSASPIFDIEARPSASRIMRSDIDKGSLPSNQR